MCDIYTYIYTHIAKLEEIRPINLFVGLSLLAWPWALSPAEPRSSEDVYCVVYQLCEI